MKNLTYIFVFLLSFVFTNAQETPRPDFKNMTPEQRREIIKKMSPEQRQKLMQDAATMMAIRNLEIPPEKQDAFKKLLNEYVQSQKAIKDKFKPDFSKNAPFLCFAKYNSSKIGLYTTPIYGFLSL